MKALADSDPRLRAHAVKLASLNSRSLPAVIPLASDRNARVQLEVALALGGLEAESERERLLESLALATTNRWIRLAAASSSRRSDAPWIAQSLPKALPGRPVPAPRGADANRARVLEQFKPALQLTGDRAHGATTFGKLCMACHYLQGQGQRVGPDLSGIGNRPAETLLTDLLDPSRQVAPDYAVYEVTLTSGEIITGMIASEAATRITLRHPGTPDESIARSQIREVRATGRSLMPEGLEQGLSVQDLADLMEFLRQPDVGLLPK
jgi:putative heme-binding domain-containing protein